MADLLATEDESPLLELMLAPHPVLRRQARPVERVTQEIRDLMEAMLEAMYRWNGIGLAANQINRLERVLVMDVPGGGSDRYPESGDQRPHQVASLGEPIRTSNPYCMANPEILQSSPYQTPLMEGCLSFPDQQIEVYRPDTVRVRYLDAHNELCEQDFTGLEAKCVQHEIDHLNGRTIDRYLSPLRRNLLLTRLGKRSRPS